MSERSAARQLSLDSPLGPITLTEYDGAITALDWGACEDQQPTALLRRAADQLARYFTGTLREFDLPLAPQGTPFQQKVWARMAQIPYGQVMTYGALAQAVDSAPRAIGGACGHNPIAIILPCHRVIAGTGALTGYSGMGGTDTKRFLLELEGALPPELALPA